MSIDVAYSERTNERANERSQRLKQWICEVEVGTRGKTSLTAFCHFNLSLSVIIFFATFLNSAWLLAKSTLASSSSDFAFFFRSMSLAFKV